MKDRRHTPSPGGLLALYRTGPIPPARCTPARRQDARDGFSGRLARRVQRRPWLAAAGIIVLLRVAALPFPHASYGLGDPRTLPQASQDRQVAMDLRQDGRPWPAQYERRAAPVA